MTWTCVQQLSDTHIFILYIVRCWFISLYHLFYNLLTFCLQRKPLNVDILYILEEDVYSNNLSLKNSGVV